MTRKANDIALVVPARMHSQRVLNKMLSPFAGTTLFDICMEKLESFRDFAYTAVWEPELASVAERHGIKVLERTEESARATTGQSIHACYLKDLREETVLFLSACLPLLSVETIGKAVKAILRLRDEGTFQGMVGAYPVRRWVWNGDGEIVNSDPYVNDSRLMEPIWVSANCLYAFDREYYLKALEYWDFSLGGPALFHVDVRETVDVDTPNDFDVAESLWFAQRQQSKDRRRVSE